MGYTGEQAAEVRQLVNTGDTTASQELTSTNTTQIIELSIPASKITLQPSGDLAATYTVSANGISFSAGGSLAANALSTYSTNLVKSITLTWTSGAGYVTILSIS